jgi:hypothetical protein
MLLQSTTLGVVNSVHWKTVQSWRDAQPVTSGDTLMAPTLVLDDRIMSFASWVNIVQFWLWSTQSCA